MRNLKKVLALVVAVAMLASFGFVASAASYSDVASNANYADAVNLLSNLGILTGYEDGTFRPANTVTRAEAATMMVRMLGMTDGVEAGDTIFTDVPADHWASGFVNVAVANGIVNGMGDGTFAPEGEVTYGQIVKMLVCALGYEPVAADNGGWNGGGYIYAGSKAGFTKGVPGTANAAASRSVVARLIYNALEVELMDQVTYSNGVHGGTWQTVEDETILNKYLGLEKVEGVIISTYLSNVTEFEAGVNEVEMVITKNYEYDLKYNPDVDYPVGHETFVADGTDAATLLGYTVVAYVGEDEDGVDTMYAVTSKSAKNDVLTLDTELIEELDETGIVYYKSETSKKTTEAGVQNFVEYKVGDEDGYPVENIVINGFNGYYDAAVLYAAVDAEAIDEITLLDNDNDGEYEFIFATIADENSVEFLVEEIDTEDDVWTIIGETIKGANADVELDFADEDMLITIVKDGKIVDVDAIAAGDIVTVLDTEVAIRTVYVSSVVLEATVDEVDDDEYLINGKDYKLSTIYDDVDALEAGDEGLFYLNASGKIAYIDEVNSVTSADYVYLIDADVSEGDFNEDSIIIKVMTAAGEVEVLTIKEKKVDVYEGDVKVADDIDAVDVYNNYLLTLDETADLFEEGEEEVETYVANTGLIKIDTTAAGEVNILYFPEDAATLDDEADGDFVRFNNYAEENEKEFNAKRETYGVIDLSADTIVFNIDDDADEDLEDRITVTTAYDLFVDGNSYQFVAFGTKDDAAEALVTWDAKTAVDAEAPVMVITKVAKVVSGDDDTYKITGVVDGEIVSVIVDPDEKDDAATLEKGNVILYAESGAYVTDVELLFAATKDVTELPADVAELAEDSDIVTTESEEAVSIHYGEITDASAKYVEVSDAKYYYSDDVRVIVVDYSYNNVSIKAGKTSSVKESTEQYTRYAFVKTLSEETDEITDVVVFVVPAEDVVEDGEEEVPSETDTTTEAN